jgi:hypothetical protein
MGPINQLKLQWQRERERKRERERERERDAQVKTLFPDRYKHSSQVYIAEIEIMVPTGLNRDKRKTKILAQKRKGASGNAAWWCFVMTRCCIY